MEIHKTKKKTPENALFWPSIPKAEKTDKKEQYPNKRAQEHYWSTVMCDANSESYPSREESVSPNL